MIVGALVFPPGNVGITDASTTRKPVDAAHAQLRVDDGGVVAAHAAGADRVVDGFGLGPDIGDQFAVVQVVAPGWMGAPRYASKAGWARMSRDKLCAFEHHPEVDAFRIAEVVGLDPRVVGSTIACQCDAASTARAQITRMDGIAVAPEPMAAMVVEHRGNEMQLDVGAVVGRKPRSYERTGLGDVAGARASMAAQEIIEGDAQVAEPIVGHRLGRMSQRADVQVVLQVLADARKVGDDIDAEPAQLRRRADSGQHQQLRGVDRAAADDDIPRRLVERLAVRGIDNAIGARACATGDVERDPGRERTGLHGEVAARTRRIEIRHCG
jgi:hypothetical protein